MTGKTHQALGLTAGFAWYIASVAPYYNPATLASVLVASSLAALLPDIDQPTAQIWHKIPIFGHTAGKVASKMTFGHRNITHSLLGFVLINFGLFKFISAFPEYWSIDRTTLFAVVVISYGLHLLSDAFTVEGIPILFPYQRMFGIPPKPFEGIRIQSGKWFENLILFPIINIVLLVLIISNWDKVGSILFK